MQDNNWEDKNRLEIHFEKSMYNSEWNKASRSIMIFDDGQACCEERYVNTADNPMDYIGAVLHGIVQKYAGKTEGNYEYKESVFY